MGLLDLAKSKVPEPLDRIRLTNPIWSAAPDFVQLAR